MDPWYQCPRLFFLLDLLASPEKLSSLPPGGYLAVTILVAKYSKKAETRVSALIILIPFHFQYNIRALNSVKCLPPSPSKYSLFYSLIPGVRGSCCICLGGMICSLRGFQIILLFSVFTPISRDIFGSSPK